MTIKPFTRYGRTIPPGSYMNVDADLYAELVLRKRVALPKAEYEAKYGKKKAGPIAAANDIESAAQRIAEEEYARSMQHVVVHHVDATDAAKEEE